FLDRNDRLEVAPERSGLRSSRRARRSRRRLRRGTSGDRAKENQPGARGETVRCASRIQFSSSQRATTIDQAHVSKIACLRAAARQAEGANLRRIRLDAFLQIIAHVPDRAVVVRVHGGLCIVLPSHRVLRALSFDEDRFPQSEYAWRIGGEPAGESLARKVW